MQKSQIFLSILILTTIFAIFMITSSNSNNSKVLVIRYETVKSKTTDYADLQRLFSFYDSIVKSEKKVFSQQGEDGVLQRLTEVINVKRNGFYVEFGTQTGVEINTRLLREQFNWTGLLMDGSNQNPAINLFKETILFSNILDLFEKHEIQDNIDIFSEDTDYADYWIVKRILTKYHPKIVVHEVNQQLNYV